MHSPPKRKPLVLPQVDIKYPDRWLGPVEHYYGNRDRKERRRIATAIILCMVGAATLFFGVLSL
jgi:hypothetical protein